MLGFLIGYILGVGTILFILFVFFFDPWGPPAAPHHFIEQFPPIQIPPELKKFLRTGEDGQGVSRWESCSSLSLLLHMLYQEHKDTRALRRWLYKRLQVELNDVVTRTPLGRFVQDIRILDLSLGTKFPVINNIRVERVEMSEDRENFEKMSFVIDLEYSGNFETSIGVWCLGKTGNLSLKVTRLAGLVRLELSRKPYNHWSFCFIAEPVFEFDVTSQLNGHSLSRLIPLITSSLKLTVRKKFVAPNFKIRYRPLFPHPLLQPSPPLGAFSHIKLRGGLEVTVLQCTRLRTSLVSCTGETPFEVYATVAVAHRPFIHSSSSSLTSSTSASHSLTCLLHYSRYDPAAPIGLTFERNAMNHGVRAVRVANVASGSLAEKATIRPGDVFVAINNVPVRQERQVNRLMSTIGDLMILVERTHDEDEEEGVEEDEEVIIRNRMGDGPDSEFVCIGGGRSGSACGSRSGDAAKMRMGDADERSSSPLTDSLPRRHSLSQLPSSSLAGTETSSAVPESLCSSLHDIASIPSTSRHPSTFVQRTESARVPSVLVSVPSVELRRARSESELLTVNSEEREDEEEERLPRVEALPLGRSAQSIAERDAVLGPETKGGDTVDGRKEDTVVEGMRGEERTVDVDDGGNETLTAEDARLQPTGSCASLASSTRTDEDDTARFGRGKNAASKRQRLRDTIQAGKKKVFDLMPSSSSLPYRRRPHHLPSMADDVGVDVALLDDDLLQLPVESAESTQRASPTPSVGSGKKSPTETERTKRKRKGRESSSPQVLPSTHAPSSSLPSSSLPPPPPPPRLFPSLSTRPVHFADDVIWGQSLHFSLDQHGPKAPKYLNVTIHAREQRAKEGEEPAKPILLGYTSLFLPQILDDCQLTLSNAHREVFHLKPPSAAAIDAAVSGSPSLTEFSVHHGFDARLCFGDVTLRFRYFADGLPKGSGINPGCETGETEEEDGSGRVGSSTTPPPTLPVGHAWKTISCSRNSAVCALCRGKIWLKSGSCCQKCLIVCHHKCAMKANTAICCTPGGRSPVEDEELRRELFGDPSLVVAGTEEKPREPKRPSPTGGGPPGPLKESPTEDEVSISTAADGDTPMRGSIDSTDSSNPLAATSRRAKLRSKMSGVTERFSHWRKRGKNGETIDEGTDTPSVSTAENDSRSSEGAGRLSTVSTAATLSGGSMTSSTKCIMNSSATSLSLATELADIAPEFEGAPDLTAICFNPAQAYSEDTVATAKRLGRFVLEGVEAGERRRRLNAQIDRIKAAISEAKVESVRIAMNEVSPPASSSPTTPSEGTVAEGSNPQRRLETLENRIHALAILLLFYCAGVQDCDEDGSTSVQSSASKTSKDSSRNSGDRSSPTPSANVEVAEEALDHS